MMNENHENQIPEENHCKNEAGMTAASQEHTSANAQAEAKEQPHYEHIHAQPEPDPVLKELAKQRKSMKRTMVTGFLCCGLLAGGVWRRAAGQSDERFFHNAVPVYRQQSGGPAGFSWQRDERRAGCRAESAKCCGN